MPLFTSLEESFNTSLFSKSALKEEWSIGLDVSAMGMFIPDAQKSFNAERPDEFGNQSVVKTSEIRDGVIVDNYKASNIQPTIFGGYSTPIFSAPQYDGYAEYYTTVAYIEGNNINFFSGLPIIQLIGKFPTRTELRFRTWFFPIQDENLVYYAFSINQRIDNFFDWFPTDPDAGVAVNLAYHTISRTGIKLKSWSLGINCSKTWEEKFTAYAMLQYEDMRGNFIALKSPLNPGEVIKSPYPEVRASQPLAFDIKSFNNFRLGGGLAYKFGFFELHADAAWASQPILSLGGTFWFARWNSEEDINFEKIEKIEKFENVSPGQNQSEQK